MPLEGEGPTNLLGSLAGPGPKASSSAIVPKYAETCKIGLPRRAKPRFRIFPDLRHHGIKKRVAQHQERRRQFPQCVLGSSVRSVPLINVGFAVAGLARG